MIDGRKTYKSNIYILKSEKYLKIGKANDIEKRIHQLQTGNPIRIDLVGYYPCKNDSFALDLENSIHRILKRYKYRGEWFEMSVEEIKEILKYFIYL